MKKRRDKVLLRGLNVPLRGSDQLIPWKTLGTGPRYFLSIGRRLGGRARAVDLVSFEAARPGQGLLAPRHFQTGRVDTTHLGTAVTVTGHSDSGTPRCMCCARFVRQNHLFSLDSPKQAARLFSQPPVLPSSCLPLHRHRHLLLHLHFNHTTTPSRTHPPASPTTHTRLSTPRLARSEAIPEGQSSSALVQPPLSPRLPSLVAAQRPPIVTRPPHPWPKPNLNASSTISSPSPSPSPSLCFPRHRGLPLRSRHLPIAKPIARRSS